MTSEKLPIPKGPVRFWDQLPEEGDVAYRAFQIFRNMDPKERSHQAVASMTGRSVSTIQKQAHANQWTDRARAWEGAKARHTDDTILSELEKKTREQLDALKACRILGTLAISAHLQRAKELAKENPTGTHIDARTALSLLRESIQLERLLLGEVNARVDVVNKLNLDLTKLDEEEAENLILLLSKIGAFDDDPNT